jgi:hypothetical protein
MSWTSGTFSIEHRRFAFQLLEGVDGILGSKDVFSNREIESRYFFGSGYAFSLASSNA